ncbi:MAG: hypothetical protein J6C75_08020, partial [Oscillospiraceae bacterium]|nr:hypothetical protein [Oscillospiraceae bacterium]
MKAQIQGCEPHISNTREKPKSKRIRCAPRYEIKPAKSKPKQHHLIPLVKTINRKCCTIFQPVSVAFHAVGGLNS